LKIRTLSLWTLFFLVSTAAIGLAETAYKLSTYSNQNESFAIGLPDAWEKREGFMGTTVLALSAQESSSDTFRENVNVAVEQLQFSMTEKKYVEASIAAMKIGLTDFTLEKRGALAGEKGMIPYLIYSHRQGVFRLKVLAGLTAVGSRGYAISFSTTEENFDQWRPIFEKILRTFQVTR